MKTALFSGVLLALGAAARAQTAPANWQHLEGQTSGIVRPMAEAVQDPQKWTEIWSEHDAADPAPVVDFSCENVVVVFLGEKRTAGITVKIVVQKDPAGADRLNVFYREVPAKSFAAERVSQPYAIVKVPRARTIDVEPDAPVSIPERAPGRAVDAGKIRALEGASNVSFDGR